MIGCLQALETIKYLTGVGRTSEGHMLIVDGSATEFQKLELTRNPECPVCGDLGGR
jgi:adenylyltransferase/sulfurtransferase